VGWYEIRGRLLRWTIGKSGGLRLCKKKLPELDTFTWVKVNVKVRNMGEKGGNPSLEKV